MVGEQTAATLPALTAAVVLTLVQVAQLLRRLLVRVCGVCSVFAAARLQLSAFSCMYLLLTCGCVASLWPYLAGVAADATTLAKECGTLLAALLRNSESESFREPVDFAEYGILDYPDVIAAPMDLGTVRRRLAEGHYGTDGTEILHSVHRDTVLVFENCMKYNAPRSEIWKAAQKLSLDFSKAIAGVRQRVGLSEAAVARAEANANGAAAACARILADMGQKQKKPWPSSSSSASSPSVVADLQLPPPGSAAEHAQRPASFATIAQRVEAGFYGGPHTCLPSFASDVHSLLSAAKEGAGAKAAQQQQVDTLLAEFRRLMKAALLSATAPASAAARERTLALLEPTLPTVAAAEAFERCARIVALVRKHPCAEVFIDPVPAEYEDYYQAIATPMCVSQAHKNLQEKMKQQQQQQRGGKQGTNGHRHGTGSTELVADFARDMRLIWTNCCQCVRAGVHACVRALPVVAALPRAVVHAVRGGYLFLRAYSDIRCAGERCVRSPFVSAAADYENNDDDARGWAVGVARHAFLCCFDRDPLGRYNAAAADIYRSAIDLGTFFEYAGFHLVAPCMHALLSRMTACTSRPGSHHLR